MLKNMGDRKSYYEHILSIGFNITLDFVSTA